MAWHGMAWHGMAWHVLQGLFFEQGHGWYIGMAWFGMRGLAWLARMVICVLAWHGMFFSCAWCGMHAPWFCMVVLGMVLRCWLAWPNFGMLTDGIYRHGMAWHGLHAW